MTVSHDQAASPIAPELAPRHLPTRAGPPLRRSSQSPVVPRRSLVHRVALLALLSTVGQGCANYSCETLDIREGDWAQAPRRLGFSGQDFVDAFPARWRAEVLRARNPFGPPALDTMVQDWTWSWEPVPDEPVLYRRRSDTGSWLCDATGWSGEPDMLLLPASVQGSSDDGTWAYDGQATLAVWALPTDDEPFPLYWMTAFSDMSQAVLPLTRAPEAFGTQAAEALSLPEPPPVTLQALGWPGGYGFDLYVDAGDGELGGFIGGSPWMALTEPE